MANIIQGNILAKDISKKTKKLIDILALQKITPKLIVFLVGNNKASLSYVQKKQKAAKKLGMKCEIIHYDKKITTEELIKNIKQAQSRKRPHGCIVQLPLPRHIETQKILNTIKPEKDIDCLNELNLGRLVTKALPYFPPTIGAIMHIIEEVEHIDLKEKHVVIVGAGILVGKPLTHVMLNKEATVTVCNKYTQNLKKLTKHADILVTAVGQKDLIKKDMIKKGAIIIDVGVSFEGKKMYGDAQFEKILKKVKSITPTPGGVGPLTVAFLLHNCVIAASTKK
jgi:methylenetetrahydrofolate dehydrogenase (NADP+) / methenyltetrahydrofolate cyclohydrolase